MLQNFIINSNFGRNRKLFSKTGSIISNFLFHMTETKKKNIQYSSKINFGIPTWFVIHPSLLVSLKSSTLVGLFFYLRPLDSNKSGASKLYRISFTFYTDPVRIRVRID
jgi:hypothetical protein